MVNDMYYTVGHRVVLLDNTRVLIDIDKQRVVIHDVTIGSHLNIVIIHIDGRQLTAHVGGEISLVLYNMSTRDSVALLFCQSIDRGKTVFLQVILYSLISRYKDSIVSVGLQSRQIVTPLQNGLELTELCLIGLNEAGSSKTH